jgi:type IV secretion system protein VirB5
MIFSKSKPTSPHQAAERPAKAPQTAVKADKTALPYLHARREWDERYGDLLTRTRNWQIVALTSIATAALAVAGIAWIGSQSKIQPFVVAVDQLGNPVAVARPQALARGAQIDERVIRSQLATFISNSRTLLSDVAGQQVLFDRTFAMIDQSLAGMMTTHLRDGLLPAQRNGTTISVQIRSVIPISADTWQVDWTETTQQIGASATPQQWRALVTVSLSDEIANDPARSIWNPFGLVVRQLSWQKVSL